MDNPILAPSVDREHLAQSLADLRNRADSDSDSAIREFGRLEADFQTLADEARGHLLQTSLTWSEEDRREATWLRRTSDGFALRGYALCDSLARRRGWDDELTRHMMARTLYHMGDVLKWEVAVRRGAPHDFSKPHALIRAAMASGHHRDPLRMRFDGRDVACTLESLYFRALLLARFSSGALNSKQIEILDAWMWLWMPALQGVDSPPGEGALRVDLDSSDGLKLGPRPDAGPTLYLPPGPIEDAYRCIIREFHAGRMVPSQGITAGFRLEEHVAVLDLIRQGLREAAGAHTVRAQRHETDLQVELHAGLSEVLTRGFLPRPPSTPTLTLAARDGEHVLPPADRDRGGASDLFERHRRMVRVANASDTGFGLEGSDADCGGIGVGEIVALRLQDEGPLELCKVVRCVPSAPGRTWLGVRRISARARPIEVLPSRNRARQRDMTLLFVPGEDESGRHDACLVPERTFTESKELEAYLGGCIYTFQFNRPRDRGRGWVLAGFEIMASVAASGSRSA